MLLFGIHFFRVELNSSLLFVLFLNFVLEFLIQPVSPDLMHFICSCSVKLLCFAKSGLNLIYASPSAQSKTEALAIYILVNQICFYVTEAIMK